MKLDVKIGELHIGAGGGAIVRGMSLRYETK